MNDSDKIAIYSKASAKALLIYLDLKNKDSKKAEVYRKIGSRYLKLAIQLDEAFLRG